MRKTHPAWHVGGFGARREHTSGGNSECETWEVGRGVASLKNEPHMRRELMEEGEVSERLESQAGSEPAGSPTPLA